MPGRVSFWHVFVASAVHGARTAADADALLARLGGIAPAEAAARGDTFSVGPHVVAQSPRQVEKLFGAALATTVEGAETGTWVGPVPSPYGLHLVWVEAREPGASPPFAAVRQRVVERWQDEARARRVGALLRDLERRYPLQVESAAWRQRSTS